MLDARVTPAGVFIWLCNYMEADIEVKRSTVVPLHDRTHCTRTVPYTNSNTQPCTNDTLTNRFFGDFLESTYQSKAGAVK